MPSTRKNHGVVGEAERIKAELILKTAAADQIDALALGETDWHLGRAFIEEQVVDLPVLAANLTCDGVAPWPGSKVVERGGLQVGIVGVTAGEVEGCTVGEPIAALSEAVAGLGEVDLVVGLLPFRLARLPDGEPLGIDVVVTGGEPVKYDELVPWRGGFKAGAGAKTKVLGRISAHKVEGASEWAVDASHALEAEIKRTEALRERIAGRLAGESEEARKDRYTKMIERYDASLAESRAELEALRTGDAPKHHLLANRLIELDDAVVDHEETLARVTAAKARITEVATQGQDLAALAAVPRMIPGHGPFAGSDQCKSCHTAQHAQWQGTGHARAYKGLVDVDRAMDPECYSCHVTGADAEGGPKSAALVGPFRDVQCESCHGPSGEHARDPAKGARPVRTPDSALCETCHDGERDMGRFELDRYLKRVEH